MGCAAKGGVYILQHLGDITKLSGYTMPPVDCITFGSPCQDLSIAGLRAGLSGERSGLFLHAVRIIREMRDATHGKYPTYAVWENVPGAFSSGGKKDFAAVLQALCAVAGDAVPILGPPRKWLNAGQIMGDGYSIAWRVYDAQYWGVPQRRRRIYLVADFGGQRAPQILFERQGLPGDNCQIGAAGQAAARVTDGCAAVPNAMDGGAGSLNCMTPWDVQSRRIYTPDGAWPALYSGEGGGHGYVMAATGQANAEKLVDLCPTLNCNHEQPILYDCRGLQYLVRRLTPLECERLQGYPDGWTDIPEYIDDRGRTRKVTDSARYKALGNSVAIPCVYDVLSHMAPYLPAGATLGSLFDGIGGFPLVWERLHGRGSALWASEIEPYPQAVTAYHFGFMETQ